MSIIYLPFYSDQALELLYYFVSYVNGNYCIYDIHDRRNVTLVVGCSCSGQILLKTNLKDEKVLPKIKLVTKKMLSGDCQALSKTIGSLFEEYSKLVLDKVNFESVYKKLCKGLSKDDVIAFKNWLKTGNMSGFSDEFIGGPYDPFKEECIRIILSKLTDELMQVKKESSFLRRRSLTWKAKETYLSKIYDLTKRYTSNFYRALDDDVAELFET